MRVIWGDIGSDMEGDMGVTSRVTLGMIWEVIRG